MPVDLTPTARLVADLVAGIPDDARAAMARAIG